MDTSTLLLPTEEENEEDYDIVGEFSHSFAGSHSDENQTPQPSYIVLSEDGVHHRQEEDILAITSLLSISRAEAILLLRHCNWSETKLHDQWFVDEESVRKVVGLLKNPVVEFLGAEELPCGLCTNTFPKAQIYSASCGHPFCSTCWAGYIGAAVNDGPSCLMLRCPDSSCDAAVGEDMVNVLSFEDDSGKYAGYLIRSYTEDSMKVKRCPAAGCDYAVEFVGGADSYDVTCPCSYWFCWKCTEEAHHPVDCSIAANWISTYAAVSELFNLVLAESKICPKCKVSVEKKQGSMHITCNPDCKFEFCWLCLGSWTEHNDWDKNGGSYACQLYDVAKQNNCYFMSAKHLADYTMERYTHYYERWAANQSSKEKAMEDLQLIQNGHLQKLVDTHFLPKSDLYVITEAWSQIVECRHVLQWTYAYGCQLPEHGNDKRQFFEYLQAGAEANLEKLHHFVEEGMKQYLVAEIPSIDLNQFHTKVASLTRVTRNYFKSLKEVVAMGYGGSSKIRSKIAKAQTLMELEARWEIDDTWACDRCTYANPSCSSACLLCVEAMKED